MQCLIAMHFKDVSFTICQCYSCSLSSFLVMKCEKVMWVEKVMRIPNSPQYLTDLNPLWPETMVTPVHPLVWAHCAGMVFFDFFLSYYNHPGLSL